MVCLIKCLNPRNMFYPLSMQLILQIDYDRVDFVLLSVVVFVVALHLMLGIPHLGLGMVCLDLDSVDRNLFRL
jgi:hypothetical protein